MKIRKNDTVKVLYGKDAGKTGKVLNVDRKNQKIIVDGVAIIKKHIKKNPILNTKSEIKEKSMPISSSKVMLVCPNCGKTTRIGMKFIDGKKVRFCKKCENNIDNLSSK